MLNKSADYFENMARQLGLSIHLPRPGKTAVNTAVLINGLAGIGLIASGAVIKKVPLILLGTLSIAGTAILKSEK